MASTFPPRTIHYQWELSLYAQENTTTSTPQTFGYTVLDRFDSLQAKTIRFQIYLPEDKITQGRLFLVGAFNSWGECSQEILDKHEFTKKGSFLHVCCEGLIKHKDPYLFLFIDNSTNKKTLLRDPASVYFDEQANSIFWDFADPKAYKKKYADVELIQRPSIILQTELKGLLYRWHEGFDDIISFENFSGDACSYILQAGILDYIKKLGFNTIQWLPVHRTIDGENWKHKYLSCFPFSFDTRYGNPDSFAQLVDECHKRNIAVICDVVIGHAPYKDFSFQQLKGEAVGLGLWDETFGKLFFDEKTPWGTKRYNFDDIYIQQFITQSVLFFEKNYAIDGIRIDNLDGLLRYGDNGQGFERPYGRLFLRNFIQTMRKQKSNFLIHVESHYFYGDNARLLVAPQTMHERALGVSAYTSSRLTYWFHTEFMPKAAEDISLWSLEKIRQEKEWGKSASTVADFHNHDAAAGLMPMRTTGSYAYDALTLGNKDLQMHAIGKIRVMQAYIAFCCEGRFLNLLQTFLLQTGTFEHDVSIHWNLLSNKDSAHSIDFLQKVNFLVKHNEVFWPQNTLTRTCTHVDDTNKVLVYKKQDVVSKKEFIVIINFGANFQSNYLVGVSDFETYTCCFDSAYKKGVGFYNGTSSYTLHSKETDFFEYQSYALCIKKINPYHILIFQKNMS
ncbi:MAG: alpha-amylase family glycosyl hydrolase [Candidatus Nanoarchaeia archaeon]